RTPTRVARPARIMVTSVIATWLRMWVRLPHNPGRTVPPANLRRVIDPSHVASQACRFTAVMQKPESVSVRTGANAARRVGLTIPSAGRLLWRAHPPATPASHMRERPPPRRNRCNKLKSAREFNEVLPMSRNADPRGALKAAVSLGWESSPDQGYLDAHS